MDPKLTLEVQLPALMVESIIYGVYLITFFVCLQRLIWDSRLNRRSLRGMRFKMIFVVVLFFVSSSLHLALTLVRNMGLFLYSQTPGHENGINRLGQNWFSIIMSTTITLQTIIADNVLIYRCWLVWNRSLVVVLFPLVCWFGSIACAVWIFCARTMLQLGSTKYARKGSLYPVAAGFWGCTILVNAISSGMILYRIWEIERAWSPPSICSLQHIPQRSRLQFAKRVIVQSGLVYTASTIIVFISHFYKPYTTYITSAAEIHITGITFNLILMRAGGPYLDRVESIPTSREFDTALSSGLVTRSTADVAIMATEDLDYCSDSPQPRTQLDPCLA